MRRGRVCEKADEEAHLNESHAASLFFGFRLFEALGRGVGKTE
jgi:hypothetical protein